MRFVFFRRSRRRESERPLTLFEKGKGEEDVFEIGTGVT